VAALVVAMDTGSVAVVVVVQADIEHQIVFLFRLAQLTV
jgi:hypothetical protein